MAMSCGKLSSFSLFRSFVSQVQPASYKSELSDKVKMLPYGRLQPDWRVARINFQTIVYSMDFGRVSSQ